MNNKQIITVLLLATIFGAVSGYIGARFGAERVSAYHLAKAQNVTPFLVRVPGDSSENDQVRLEVVDEEGVIDYSRIGGKPGGRERVTAAPITRALSTFCQKVHEITEELDVIALLKDLPERELIAGQVGTVVEILDEGVFEVDFSDDEGKTMQPWLSVGKS